MYHLYHTNRLIPEDGVGVNPDFILKDHGEFQTRDEVWDEINSSVDKEKYTRVAWDPGKNEIYIDYGSWSNFFNIKCDSEDAMNSFIHGGKKSEINYKERDDYMSWNEYFMKIATLASLRSKDPKTKVGCCLVNEDTHHILSVGYNGLPRGMDDKDFNWDEIDGFDKNPYIVHAEANAVLNADASIEGATAFVTMFPCPECAKLLVQSKIKKIIYRDEKFLKKSSGAIASEIFRDAGVIMEHYREDDNYEIRKM